MTVDIFEQGLGQRPANHVPLTPLSFLRRSAAVFPNKKAVIHGKHSWTYAEFYQRCQRLASAISGAGVKPGQTVSILAPNVPVLLEAHYGVAMAGAVLNAINTRLDAKSIAFILNHAEAKLLITDSEYLDVITEATETADWTDNVVQYNDPQHEGSALAGDQRIETIDYEAFLAGSNENYVWQSPSDEWNALSLNYTSGTTGDPKGVVYSHRGAYLNSLGNVLAFGLDTRSVYLWTLPMFHCNGWTYTWAVTAASGTHVCLRKVERHQVFSLIRDHGVTHMCGAPIILNMLADNAAETQARLPHPVRVATGGAAPPTSIIRALEQLGFDVTHLYGLTESYGPATVCVWQDDWSELDFQKRGALMARQGINHVTVDDVIVADPKTLEEIPRDGKAMGEIMLRGNTVMKGYLKNNVATEESLRDGWFRTGDLAVWHDDGYIEIKDRSKDIIISGGENISSLEIEEAIYSHPGVLEAAVVARPDDKWGETPCAFVTTREGASLTESEIVNWCRDRIARFKAPRTVLFEELPKTSTGKIQKHLLRNRAKKLT